MSIWCIYSLTEVNMFNGIKNISDEAFENCDNLEHVDLPNTIEIIGNSLFRDCKNLKSITIPEGISLIHDYAFAGCKNLETVIVPDSLHSIGSYAFNNCSRLKNTDLPDELYSIGDCAFFGCEKLTNVYLSDTVESIGEDAFYYRNRFENHVEPIKDLKIYCYTGSYAEMYALNYYLNYRLIQQYPEVSKIIYNEKYHQFRINWTVADGAEKYGIAVKLAGKWKVQAYTDAFTTSFTSPKLKAGSKYQMVICAKVNGEWDTSNISGRAFTVTVK